jgi:5-dehydro-2-deoxygluconokinase
LESPILSGNIQESMMAEKRFDVISLGRLAVDLYANQMGVALAEVSSFNVYAGGCPANIAVGARRLGLRVAMCSRIGVDGLSDGLIKFMEAEGIHSEYITRDPDHLPGLAFLSILPPDTFPLVYFRPDPADLYLGIEDVKAVPIEESHVLVTSGTGFSGHTARSGTLYAMERARAVGTVVALDLDLRRTLWKDLDEYGVQLRSALPLTDIVIGTEDEILAASGCSTIKEAVALMLKHVRLAVAVKRGQAGSEVYTPDGSFYKAQPFKVNVLNVLGAGDAWAGGFLYGYINGWEWERCARFGNATGAIIVTRHACANDMPTLKEVDDFIETQKAGVVS